MRGVIIKKAIITGVTGQDGAYLSDFLLKKGYKVYGTYRRLSTPNFWRLQALGILDKVELVSFDLGDQSSVISLIKNIQPDEVYNLAAQSFVGTSFEQPINAGEVTGLGVTRIIDTIKSLSPDTKFYQASSSEMFGEVQEIPQTEKTPFYPRSPYAVAKLYGHWITKNYRESYNLFACSGILFNHESPLRGLEFVTRKITNSAAKIKLGLQKDISLGNIEAKRDWGYSADYVKAMWLMLQNDKPDDYVVATNQTHAVREFLEFSFGELGLNYKDYLKVDQKFFRPAEVNLLIGDYAKAKSVLGWKPEITFKELVRMMVKADLQRWKDFLDGKHFPWDADRDVDSAKTFSSEYKLDVS